MSALLRQNHIVTKIPSLQPTMELHSKPAVFLHTCLPECLSYWPRGHFGTMIYNLPIPQGYKNYDITHLEITL